MVQYMTSNRSAKVMSCLIILPLIHGCSALFEARAMRAYRIGSLDKRRSVLLVEDRQHSAISKRPEDNFATLQLTVTEDGVPYPLVEKTVAHKTGSGYKDLPSFDCESLEGRTSPDRRRIWIVDKRSGRIVASYEFETDTCTGPDDQPPEWADPHAGIPLES